MSEAMKAEKAGKHKIMVVDDNITNLTLAKKVLEGEYSVAPVTSGEKALALLARLTPALILLDIDMPGLDGFETLGRIKAMDKAGDIPVIFLTANDDAGSELAGLKLGAVDYITKPFSPPLLLQRVALHISLMEREKELQNYNDNLAGLVKEQTEIISELQHAVVRTITDMIESRGGYTGGYAARTQKYLGILARALADSGFYSEEVQDMDLDLLCESMPLRGIGKIATPDYIWQKPGRLTEAEFDVVKQYPVIGEAVLKDAMKSTRAKPYLRYAAEAAISHHEKWDGSGYPYGLRGEDIPLSGRLVAIADVYEALVSDRPYKKPLDHKAAAAVIISEAGRHFDPKLVEVFQSVQDEFRKVV